MIELLIALFIKSAEVDEHELYLGVDSWVSCELALLEKLEK